MSKKKNWARNQINTIKNDGSGAKKIPDQMTYQVQDLKDPHQMTCHMPNLSLKSHQKCEITSIKSSIDLLLDQKHPFWDQWLIHDQIRHISDICPFLPSSSFPPSLFLQSQETQIPGLRECVGVIIPNPCTLNRTFTGTYTPWRC